MMLQSRNSICLVAAWAIFGSGCMVPMAQYDPATYKPVVPPKGEPRDEAVKRPVEKAETSDEPEVSDATKRHLNPYKSDKTESPRGEPAAKPPASASREAVDQAIAQLDTIPSLSDDERAQLKADLRDAQPQDIQRLVTLVRVLSQKAAKTPAKEPAPIVRVAHDEPIAPEPPPIAVNPNARPITAPPAVVQQPVVQQPYVHPSVQPPAAPQALPQIIGPNSAAAPIQILPPPAYPGAPVGAEYAQPGNPQPQIIVNPTVAPMAFPPLPVPAPQPTYTPPPQATVPPAPFPTVAAQPLSPPAAPNEPGSIAPASANQPLAAEAPLHWSKSLRDSLKALEKELATAKPSGDKNSSADAERARKAILVRLLRLAAGDQEGAVRRLEDLPPEEQDFWTHQLHALTISLDPDGPPVASRRAALALRELRQATARLASQATLEVRNLAFCSEVTGYGHFTRFPTIEFEPEQEVLLYAEIDNLQSAESKTGFRTNFQATLQVLDSAGKVVHDHSYPPGEDTCTSRRRDFFVPFRTYIPKLSPGDYTLQLTVEDTQAKKFGQNTIAFRVKRS